MGDDDAAGGLVPMAFVVEATVGADGANDVVGSGCDVCGLFEDEAEAVAELSGTLFEEAKGMGVAVNAAAVSESEFPGDVGGAAPVEEIVFDGLAAGMLADDAANGVVVEAGGRLGLGRLAGRGSGGIRGGGQCAAWKLKFALELRASELFVMGEFFIDKGSEGGVERGSGHKVSAMGHIHRPFCARHGGARENEAS